MVLAQAPLAV